MSGLVSFRVSFRGVGPACAAILVSVISGCSNSDQTPPTGSTNTVITSTTRIAGAGVLGNQRRPDESCAPEPAGLDPAPGVPDPQRIVALAGDELDALCALGLQSRIVGAALPDGSPGQPSYLGTVVHDVQVVSQGDNAAIAALNPDLILRPQADASGAQWQDGLRAVGAATGRADAANGLITGFTDRAKQIGAGIDAPHFQASVVQVTDSVIRVFGANNFPASVLAAAGVDRPAAQRFTDKPYVEIGISDTDLDRSPDLSAADGDIVYLSFASAAAKDRAPRILQSPAWRELSATRDNRVFIVNNEVWQTGQGLIAARGILDDLHWLNAPIN